MKPDAPGFVAPPLPARFLPVFARFPGSPRGGRTTGSVGPCSEELVPLEFTSVESSSSAEPPAEDDWLARPCRAPRFGDGLSSCPGPPDSVVTLLPPCAAASWSVGARPSVRTGGGGTSGSVDACSEELAPLGVTAAEPSVTAEPPADVDWLGWPARAPNCGDVLPLGPAFTVDPSEGMNGGSITAVTTAWTGAVPGCGHGGTTTMAGAASRVGASTNGFVADPPIEAGSGWLDISPADCGGGDVVGEEVFDLMGEGGPLVSRVAGCHGGVPANGSKAVCNRGGGTTCAGRSPSCGRRVTTAIASGDSARAAVIASPTPAAASWWVIPAGERGSDDMSRSAGSWCRIGAPADGVSVNETGTSLSTTAGASWWVVSAIESGCNNMSMSAYTCCHAGVSADGGSTDAAGAISPTADGAFWWVVLPVERGSDDESKSPGTWCRDSISAC